jgi:TRAP-type uncharacterized transport system substrate-binding protein
MKSKFFLAAALLVAFGAQAQQVKVSTGGPKGTYHALFANIADKCGDQMAMIEVPSDGSLTNLDRLTGKEVGAAFVQTDALFASAQGRDLGNIKTLVAFNRESVHVVVLANSGLKTSGNMVGMGKQDIVFGTAEDLGSYKIAAAGGSVVTAQLVKAQGQIGWTIVPAANTDAALSMLKSGQVQAVMMVGGQPLGDVKALGAEFKLIGFRQTTMDLLKTVYVTDRLSYPKISPTAVPTIATEALLVTRTVNTPERLAVLSNLRKCVYENIGAFRDADGAHPAWEQVNSDNKGKWAYYDLPVATAPAAVMGIKKK